MWKRIILTILFLNIVIAQPPTYEIDTHYWFRTETQIESQYGWNFELQIVNDYLIFGKVLGTRAYNEIQKMMSPMDVVVGWGDVIDEFDKISVKMEGRYYTLQYDGDKIPSNYFVDHVSNNHLVPSSKVIFDAILTIKTGDEVEISGKLVNMSGRKEESEVFWRSSILRTDTGPESSEIILVEEVTINGIKYKAGKASQFFDIENLKNFLSSVWANFVSTLSQYKYYVLLGISIIVVLYLINTLLLSGYKKKGIKIVKLTGKGRERSVEYLKKFDKLPKEMIDIMEYMKEKEEMYLHDVNQKYDEKSLKYLINRGLLNIEEE